MKKLLLLAMTVVTALNLTGCVIFHSHTDIHADGSGTAELTISISPEIQDAIAELQELDSGESENMDFPLLDDMNKAEIEQAAKDHGVEVKTFEKAMVDGRETLNIVLAFENLEGFSYVMGRIMGEGEATGDGMGIFAAADGNLVLKQAHYDFPAEPAAEEEEEAADATDDVQTMDPAQMQKQMEIMGKLMGAMADLDVNFKITVPGDIVSTNAPQTDGRSSIWTINASNMMTMDQSMDPEIVFSGKGLKIKPLQE